MTTTGRARPGDRWRAGLRADAPPQPIVDAGPERPRFLDPELFRWRPEEEAARPPRPSRLRALEALPEGGTVLDVGVGGGASSLGLGPRAGLIVGVDHSEAMLASFAAGGEVAGAAVRPVLGTWPDVAGDVEAADVAVCHHAVYGTEEIEAFVAALTSHARRRVVVEVSAQPPTAGLHPLWKALHGVERPTRAVADELQEVLVAMGLAVEREDTVLAPRPREVTPRLVAHARQRLFVGEDRDPEIAELLRALPAAEHRVVALWWPGTA